MPAAVAQGSPGDVVVAIDVPHDAGKVPRDSDVMGETPPEVTVAFEAISFWVPATLGPPSTFSKDGLKRLVPGMAKATKETKDDMRQVLFNIRGSCEPGEMLALMGPSGGGKTTLLSLLGGRAPKRTQQDGRVTFNGSRLNKRVKRQIGFVLQDDLLYATLTVQETLYFAAMLRLPKHKTKAQKLERVDAVIKALGLERCRDTIIGDHMRRGVSGGERKRVSVGHELLINPAILLLDEPTSGLDSSAARKMVELLRELASSGRVVITTIHQPSSNIYQKLDTVLLLSQGHPIFYGKGSQAAHWFERLGVACPYGVNIADWILDLASGEVTGKEKTGEEQRLHLISVSEQYLEQQPGGYMGGGIDVEAFHSSGPIPSASRSRTPSRSSSSSGTGDIEAGEMSEVRLRPAAGAVNVQGSRVDSTRVVDRSQTGLAAQKAGASRWGASYWTQFTTLFVRAIRVRRFETLSQQDLAQFLCVAAVCGMIWWQVGQTNTVYGAQNTTGLLFFEALFLAFRTMFVSLFCWPQEHKMMTKERASGMYRLSAFYLARSASDIPADLTIPTIFIAITYLMAGLRHGGYFFLNWLSVMLSTLVAQAFGLFLGATVMNAKTAQTICAVIMLTFMLVGGFYVTNIPVWIGWIKWISFLTYAFNLLLKLEFGGRTFYDCSLQQKDFNPSDPWNYVASGQCVEVTDINAALNSTTDLNGPKWEAAVLIGFLIVSRIAVYLALRFKTKP
ncbi:ABC transporter G family member 22 [Chlorella vulgaris]